MAERLKKYDIEYQCSDDYDVYQMRKVARKHVIDKAETCLVEAKNSSLRDNLARLNRKTKKYSKCIKMLDLSVSLLLFYKNFGYPINCF